MPGEIAFDADGNLFIAEQGRNRISEIKGLGQPVANVTLTPPPAACAAAGSSLPRDPAAARLCGQYEFLR